MRRLTIVVSICLVLGGALAAWHFWGGGLFGPSRVLTVFTWEDYIDPEIVTEFEGKHGCRVELVYFEDDADRDTRLAATGVPEFDLVLAGDRTIQRYMTRGWLARLDPALTPNLKHIAKRWAGFVPEVEGYAAPYFWGTSGIVYRSDLVKKPITTWKQLFNSTPELRGHVRMQRDPREITAAALMAVGAGPNSLEPAAYQKAKRLVLRQKPSVWGYSPIVPNEEDPMVTGDEVHVSPAFNGDAITLQEFKPTLEYVVPEEGGGLWMDFFVAIRNRPNLELAQRFIDFLNRPEVAAKNAESLNYATPNEAALKLLPKEFLENRAVFPDEETLKRCHPYKILPGSIHTLVEQIAKEVLPAEGGDAE